MQELNKRRQYVAAVFKENEAFLCKRLLWLCLGLEKLLFSYTFEVQNLIEKKKKKVGGSDLRITLILWEGEKVDKVLQR